MSKIQISPNPLGSGIVTLAAPNTASNVTLTLPAVTAELITNSSGVLNIGSGQIYKDASGNVGIGRVPNYKIDAYTSGTGSPAVASSNDNIVTILQSSGSSQGNIGTITSHPLVLLAANAERVRIDTFGNVGLGTASPGARIAVESSADLIGSFNGTAANGGYMVWRTSGTTIADIGTAQNCFGAGGNDTFAINGRGARSLLFGTNDQERMRIDSSGNLLVGTTSSVFNESGFRAMPIGSGSSMLLNVSNTGGGLALALNTTADTNIAQFYRSGSSVGTISVTTSATAYNTSSDYRLKENVAPMTGALQTVAALKPVTYTWKADGSDGQGFIAHELQAVVPDCVTGEKDAVDKDGKPQYQGVDTSFLVATLVSAIQELTARLEVLENK